MGSFFIWQSNLAGRQFFPGRLVEVIFATNVGVQTGQNQAETLDKFFVDAPGQNDSDLMGDSPKSKATESVGLFSTPDEASVDFEDLGFDDLDSEASFAGMTVVHECLASRGSLKNEFRGEEPAV